MDNGSLATLVATQIGFGGTMGFLLGYGLKKVAAAVLKILALVSAIFMLALAWLASMGVVSFNFTALTSTFDNSLNGTLATLLGFTTFLAQIIPMGGSFGLGFYIGAKKG